MSAPDEQKPPQVPWSMPPWKDNVPNPFCTINHVSNEVLVRICTFLSERDLARFARTSSTMSGNAIRVLYLRDAHANESFSVSRVAKAGISSKATNWALATMKLVERYGGSFNQPAEFIKKKDSPIRATVYPLHVAAAKANVTIVKHLLSKGAEVDVNATNLIEFATIILPFWKNSALYNRAADSIDLKHQLEDAIWMPLLIPMILGEQRTIQCLLAAGASGRLSVLPDGTTNITILHALAVNNDHGLARQLIPRFRQFLDYPLYETEFTPIHLAVFHRNVEYLDLLIKNGANVNAEVQFHRTALMNAVRLCTQQLVPKSRSETLAIIRLLVDAGANINQSSIFPDSETVLSAALVLSDEAAWSSVFREMRQVIELLVDRGVDINQRSASGTSVVHRLCFSLIKKSNAAREKLLQYFLSKGGDINLTAGFGDSILKLVSMEVKHKRSPTHLLKILLAAGAKLQSYEIEKVFTHWKSSSATRTALGYFPLEYGDKVPQMLVEATYYDCIFNDDLPVFAALLHYFPAPTNPHPIIRKVLMKPLGKITVSMVVKWSFDPS